MRASPVRWVASVRDILIVGIVLIGSLYALWQPAFGVMLWTWISIMSPHSLAFGFSQTFPVAAIAACAVLLGLLMTKERRNPFIGPAPKWLAVFMIWVCVTYPLSINVEGSWEMLSKVLKIDLMILVALMLLHSRKHIETLIWVIVVSLGFYGVKGGIFTIMHGGSYMVLGPGGFIGGNNELALALIVTIPLMRYLQLQAKRWWVRHGLTAAMLLTAASALGTYSRGALLAIVGMAAYLWLKSKNKVLSGVLMVLLGVALVSFMPGGWQDRMNTIQTYEQDSSAQGRFIAWETAWRIAKDRLTGAGFDMYTEEIFGRYAPVPDRIHAAHSIYFQVLGEQGFIGLFIFLAIWYSVWVTAGRMIRDGRKNAETLWCSDLGAMCQVSLVGYGIGGAFLSLAYYDLSYNILAIVVLGSRWLRAHSQKHRALEQPRAAVDVRTAPLQ